MSVPPNNESVRSSDDVTRVAHEIATAVAPHLLDTSDEPAHQCRHTLIRRFDKTTAKWRAALVAALPSALASAVNDATLDEVDGWEANGWSDVSDAEGWRGARYSVEPSIAKLVALADDCDRHVLGGWVDKSTFALIVVDPETSVIGAVASVDVDHWHPGSHTSGMYGDTVVVCNEHLAYVLEREDEDGWYLTLHGIDASSAATVASALSDLISSVDIFGAENWVIPLAVFEPDASVAASLFCSENPGYEVERVSLDAPDGVWVELRRQHPRPSPAEAVELLEELEEQLEDGWYDDTSFVDTLRAIAGDQADDQAVQS